MKLSEHVDTIRELIEAAFDKQFARLGIGASKLMEAEKLPEAMRAKRPRFEAMLDNHIGETGCYEAARAKLIDELTFTLFNRLAAIKVMESASLFPPILDKQADHGGRSFGHKAWLELRPDMREEELEGIRDYIKHAFNELGETLPLYSKDYPYALLPDAISLNEVIEAFNAVEKDAQVDDEIWQSDDVLGWTYESYNNHKKLTHKESEQKTEYNKVSLQSQVYTPCWVVQFLVENSLGKLYLEMYPGSEIKDRYKIANAPETQERVPKPLHEIKIIDPACGSGNFLLYAFDFFYELYLDQIENYGADYEERDIPKLIIEKNLHGVDLDDRAIQLAQLGLFIKAKKKRSAVSDLKFCVVSSDFYLPDYAEVEHIFSEGTKLDRNQRELIQDVWTDLQFAYKFGSLIRLDQKVKAKVHRLIAKRTEQSEKLFSNEDLGLDPELVQADIFTEHDIEREQQFAAVFFNNLKAAVEQYAQAQGNTFLSCKTRDAITFLELMTTKYDVATANPPYTDSADFGPELKSFIEANYKKPLKFHTNLYATFIKRCFDLTGDSGFIAMLHPLTFMYIQSFEDVRKTQLSKTNINLLVELGLGGVFVNSDVQVDVCMYVLQKFERDSTSIFMDLKEYKNHSNKPQIFSDAFDNYLSNEHDQHVYELPQSQLKKIKSWPYIYWISDDFRRKFESGEELGDVLKAKKGLGTQAERFFRFWWEVEYNKISKDYNTDKKKWVRYVKGGPYNKWYGNVWLVLNWEHDGKQVKSSPKTMLRNPDSYFKEGIACSLLTSKGTSFRLQQENIIYDSTTRSIFLEPAPKYGLKYLLGFLNSKLCNYILNCLNSTVTVNSNDIHRVPTGEPRDDIQRSVKALVTTNISIKKALNSYNLVEFNYKFTPLQFISISKKFKPCAQHFLNKENHFLTQVLINEAIINEKIFDAYELTEKDTEIVLAKEGKSIGSLPVAPDARTAYLADTEASKDFPLDTIRGYIEALPLRIFKAEERETIESVFPTLYRSNNDLEEFCIRHQVNPINVWFWFKQSQVIPERRMHTLAMEFLVDMVREILMEDEDGIIPLVPNAGETVLLDRIEDKFREKGFSTAQYSNFDSVLGHPIKDYLSQHFFASLSDHLKLFKRLPATPFIWHLSSGPEQGFDCYIIIYKWSRDKLMSIRSVYIEQRERSLQNRQSDLAGNESADAQNEKERIFKQLKEIEAFKAKIDELLAEGYDPILDDGVGKNIAPLQKKGMIPYEVLNAGQLKKYLNADW